MLQMSKSLIEGGGVGIHICTQLQWHIYLAQFRFKNNTVQCPYVLYCSMFVVIESHYFLILL